MKWHIKVGTAENVRTDPEQSRALKEEKKKKRVSAPEGRIHAPCAATHGCFIDGGIQEEHMFPGALSSM